MAPHLLGPCFQVTCGDCGLLFHCGEESTSVADRATCPNCGFGGNRVESAFWRPGQRVLVDRCAYWWRRPGRDEPVAFRDAGGQLTVKRVAGLPGERPGILDGDLTINGDRRQKTLPELRQLAIAVHDSAFTTSLGKLPPRWRPLGSGTWRRHARRWVAAVGQNLDPEKAELHPDSGWLVYHHWPCWPAPAPQLPRMGPSAVRDYYGYNQTMPRGPLLAVVDVCGEAETQVRGEGKLQFRVRTQADTFQLVLDTARYTVAIYQNEHLLNASQEVPASVLEAPANSGRESGRRLRITWGLCDRRVLMSIQDWQLPPLEYEPLGPGGHPQPLAVGVSGPLDLRIDRLRVFRDIYYLPPDPLQSSWSLPEPLNDEYFLLGDNQPASVDSRFWQPPGVPADRLVGRVLSW